MKSKICSLWSLVLLVLAVSMLGTKLNAQQGTQDQQGSAQQGQTQPQQQPSDQPPSQSSQPAPDQAQSQSQQSGSQTFSGTIMKSGSKYVLQSDDGSTYDLDRQDLAQSHEGRKVRVQGTLDPNGKLIHIK